MGIIQNKLQHIIKNKGFSMQKIATPCVILAGGKSSRFGQDKTQIHFGGYPLSQWLLMRFESMCENLYVSAKERDKFNFKAEFLIESSPIYAPLVGMINAFNTLDSKEIIFISVDTPFVSQETLLALDSKDSQIVYAQSEFKAHYLISKWQRSVLDSLVWAYKSKSYALHRIIESHLHEVVHISEEESLNINTMQDYENALRKLKGLER